jgi:hypothetical protein
MTKLEQIFELYPDDTFVKVDGFDDAVIGVDACNTRLVYDVSLMIECLVKEGMEVDDAIDHFEYNVVRSIPYIENAPVLVNTDFML